MVSLTTPSASLPLFLTSSSSTTAPKFLDNVKAERAKCIKRPSTFDMPQCIIDLMALYTNYKNTGLWDKTVPNHKAQLIALATHFKDKMDTEKSTRKKKPNKPNPAATQSGAGKLGKWLFENVGPTMRGPDKKNYVWCPLHGHKTDGVNSGIYMPAPHNHEAWQAGKDAKLNTWKEQKEGRAPTKRKAPVEPTAKPSAKK